MTKAYIEREALNTELVNKFKSRIGSAYVPSWNDAMDVVKSAPAADVVEVVRCGECVYRISYGCKRIGGISTPPNWYCAAGERKDGGHDA